MNNPQLKAVHPILEIIERISRGVSPFEDGPQTSQQEARPAVLDDQEMTRLRVDLRKELLQLRKQMAETLAERECYLALFPMVVCIDELVQTRYTGVGQQEWPLLQQEFFKVDQGGELFYQTIDQVLDGGPQSPIVYEMFYFCLAVGFRGKYAGDQDRIYGYMKRLSDHFAIAEFQVQEPGTVVSGAVKPVLSHWWLYAGAAVAVVLFYVILAAVSDEPDLPDMAPADAKKVAVVVPVDMPIEKSIAVTPLPHRYRCQATAVKPKWVSEREMPTVATGEGEDGEEEEVEEEEVEPSGDWDRTADDAQDDDERAEGGGADDTGREDDPASSTLSEATAAGEETGQEEELPDPVGAVIETPAGDEQEPGHAPTCHARVDYFPGTT